MARPMPHEWSQRGLSGRERDAPEGPGPPTSKLAGLRRAGERLISSQKLEIFLMAAVDYIRQDERHGWQRRFNPSHK